ncbi:neprilysin-2-like [Diaphorina citri]|uniref:Neprilysin-2-like n=1 Tax=Diaphorina citri TaxID=121845 RepID=A0A3Q0J2M5_DIACI|nr:neprilysin-2-like [Diaphorina citri]
MLMQTVLSSSAYLCKSARRPYHDFKYVLTGVNSTRIRSQRCVDEVAEKFSLAVGSLYVRHFFDRTSKENALELVNNLRQEMDYILQNVSWMDPQTKKNALEKSKVLKVHIGYPDELLDDDKIDLHYKDLRIGPVNAIGPSICLLVTGWLIFKSQPTARKLVTWNIMCLVFMLVFVTIFTRDLIQLDDRKLKVSLHSTHECSCDTSMKHLPVAPLCSSDGIVFGSPCQAGCQEMCTGPNRTQVLSVVH